MRTVKNFMFVKAEHNFRCILWSAAVPLQKKHSVYYMAGTVITEYVSDILQDQYF
jgi:hypothetical protein